MVFGEAPNQRGICDLPYDLIRILCKLLDGREIASVLSTCKTLHTYLHDEAIWQELCRRHGVRHLKDLGVENSSYFHIYTTLLHTYGPLLGLWAGDRPFRGDVVEFRLSAERTGIVGELWHMRRSEIEDDDDDDDDDDEDSQLPFLPDYCILVEIILPPSDPRSQAVINWCAAAPSSERDFGRILEVQEETNESMCYSYIGGCSKHPDFPMPGQDYWYDQSRGLPRLKVSPAPVDPVRRQAIWTPRNADEVDVIHGFSGSTVYPAALVFVNAFGRSDWEDDAIGYFEPVIRDTRNFDMDRPFRERFYPLRNTITEGQAPDDKDWQPRSLEGLWLGAYGPHGTEVLYIQYDEANRTVKALKITGDENVPRGAQTWCFELDARISPSDTPERHPFRVSKPHRLYRGSGTVSAEGFA